MNRLDFVAAIVFLLLSVTELYYLTYLGHPGYAGGVLGVIISGVIGTLFLVLQPVRRWSLMVRLR